MPNWCENTIVIEGNVRELLEFDKHFKKERTSIDITTWPIYKEYTKEQVLEFTPSSLVSFIRDPGTGLYNGYDVTTKNNYSYENFIPFPEGMALASYANNWYNWQVSNWGVKWDANEVITTNLEEVERRATIDPTYESYLTYILFTPWSEPMPVLEKMAETYPNLHFRHEFADPAVEYAGVREYEGGELLEESYPMRGAYREFLISEQGFEFYDCFFCGALLDESEIEYNIDDVTLCPNCGGTNCISDKPFSL